MKFLFDENLAPQLVVALASQFPGAVHVRSVGLACADDLAIGNFAKSNGFVIASKDGDFRQRSFRYGPPPKVVWLRLGNCPTEQIMGTLLNRMADLEEFGRDPQAGLLIIS